MAAHDPEPRLSRPQPTEPAPTEPALADPRFAAGAFRPAALRRLLADRIALLRLLRHAGPVPVAAIISAHLTGTAAVAAGAVATGRLIGAAGTAHRLGAVAGPLLAVVALIAADRAAQVARTLPETLAARRVDGAVREQVRRIALAPDGIGHLDDPGFRDDLERACDLGLGWRTRSPGNAAVGQLTLLARTATALAAAGVVATRFPVLAAALLAVSMTIRALTGRQWMWLAALDESRMADHRRAQYFTTLLSQPPAAKDVRLFGLAGWLLHRLHDAHLTARAPMWRARDSVLRRQGPTFALSAAGAAATLAVLGTSGQPTATVARCLVAAWAVMDLAALGPESFDIDYGVATVQALRRVVARYDSDGAFHGDPHNARPDTAPAAPAAAAPAAAASAAVASAPAAVALAAAPAVPPPAGARRRPPHIRFEDVTFTYRGASGPALRGLTLDIPPGQHLAVVGVNGAGKTTLVKLLAGLHAPDSGRITVDGADLRDLSMPAWRARLSALFQDFVHYDTTVADNVALSAPEHLADRAGIGRALSAAGAAPMLAALPAGVDTPLWRGAPGATGLSGGQWQKLAIARTLFAAAHDRDVLVLDEPTAHLDVEAEQEFTGRVTAGAPTATRILISHRLSTVRAADRIVVLDGGRITESGTHSALLAADGTYATLFRLQAARFATNTADTTTGMGT